MKQQNRIIGIIILTIIGSIFFKCMYLQGQSHYRINLRDTRVFAVLDFEQEGFMGGDRIGQYIADELTTALFIKHNYKIVDRAQVRDAVIERKITTSVLNPMEIRELGTALNADFLILGKLIRLNKAELADVDKTGFSFQVTFRVIAVKDGSVIGFVDHQGSGTGDVQPVLKQAIDEMTRQVKFD